MVNRTAESFRRAGVWETVRRAPVAEPSREHKDVAPAGSKPERPNCACGKPSDVSRGGAQSGGKTFSCAQCASGV